MISSLNRALSSSIAGIAEFLRLESIGGMMLVAAAAVAMVSANSALVDYYDAVLDLPVSVQAGAIIVAKPLLLWINDGLMAIFFLLVGLEIKREMIAGELSTFDRTLLPAIAAIGGMAVPAAVYVAVNISDPVTLRGWAVPTATDIAFALGAATLLGDRVPPALKILLMALAIIDDLGAIVIIAVFYSAELSTVSLVLSGLGLLILAALNRVGITRIAPYILVGVFLWVCVLKSGVHATLAGVALAFAIPIGDDPEASPLHRLEHALHGWVSYGILPIFAFANAGVPLTGLTVGTLLKPVPLGVALGLFVGKPCGVMAVSFAAVRLGIVRLPTGVGWPQFFGMSLLTGIGFTMSLFIGALAFATETHQAELRIGVLVGSLLSASAGYAVLRGVSARPRFRPISESMFRIVERLIAAALTAGRWLMAAFYHLGLVAALVIVLVEFYRELARTVVGFSEMTPEMVRIAVLKLVELVLVGNLVVILTAAGMRALASSAVAELDRRVGKLDFRGLKNKILAPIFAIAAIKLLEIYMNIGSVPNLVGH